MTPSIEPVSGERLAAIADNIEEWGETKQSQTGEILKALRELQALRTLTAAHGEAVAHVVSREIAAAIRARTP